LLTMGLWPFLFREIVTFTRSKADLWLTIIPPVLTAFFFVGSMSRIVGNVEGTSYVNFVVPGIALMSAMAFIQSMSTRMFNEGFGQSLKEYFSMPVHRSSYVLAKLLAMLALSTAYALVYLWAVGMFFGAPVGIRSLLNVTAALLLSNAVIASMFILVALLIRDMGGFLVTSNILGQLLIWGSTVFYPLNAIPNYLQPLAMINPVTYGSDLLRCVFLQNQLCARQVVYLSVFATVLGFVAIALLSKRAAKVL